MINIRMQLKDVKKLTPRIAVLGIGGAGGNAVNNMISSGLQGAEFIVCNTDAQALEGNLCENRIQLGVTVTAGLGAGARPEVGRAAAEESLDDVMQYLEGANMAFITAGMGGGTGTGAAPVIARACREKGILTVGVVTKPFHFEGSLRMKMAEAGIEEMQGYVDTLIVIPNQNLFRVANEKTTFAEAFRLADSVLQSGVRGVTDLMVVPGLINLDFADIRSAMMEMGKAMMGTGEAVGDRRAVEAAEKAINNPLLDDVSMKGARGVIVNVTGGMDMTLFEVDEACNRIRDEVDPNANIIFGSTFDERMDGIMRVSVVATGIDVAEERGRKRPVTGATLNAITAQQQERRLERAQPNAATTAYAIAPQEPVYRPAVTMPPSVRTMAPPPAAVAPAPPRRVEDPEIDMFEQREFMAETVARTEPVYAAAGGNIRGSVQGSSFIPPRPIEPDHRNDPGYGSMLGGLTARRPVEQPAQPATGYGMANLRPPRPAAEPVQQQRRRTPSLFERFTSPLRHHDEEGQQEDSGESTGGVSGGGGGSGFHQRPTQGSLNIEPQRQNIDDELDIPAFLRRQAN